MKHFATNRCYKKRAKRRGSSSQCCPARTFVSFPQSRSRRFARQAAKTRVRAHVGSLLPRTARLRADKLYRLTEKLFERARANPVLTKSAISHRNSTTIFWRGSRLAPPSGAYLTEDGRAARAKFWADVAEQTPKTLGGNMLDTGLWVSHAAAPMAGLSWPSLDEEERYHCKEAVPLDLDRGAPGGAKTEKSDRRRERFTAGWPIGGKGRQAAMRFASKAASTEIGAGLDQFLALMPWAHEADGRAALQQRAAGSAGSSVRLEGSDGARQFRILHLVGRLLRIKPAADTLLAFGPMR